MDHPVTTSHYSFLMSQKSSCFAAAWDLAPCPHSQCLFRYVLLMPTKFSCLAAAWDLAPCPHFHYLPNDLLHHQAGDRKGKVSNFRWLRDRKIGSGILSSSVWSAKIITLTICHLEWESWLKCSKTQIPRISRICHFQWINWNQNPFIAVGPGWKFVSFAKRR